MSDSFIALVDADVSAEAASDVSTVIVSALLDRQLISANQTSECVLGGEGYPAGAAIQDCYRPRRNESPFWQLRTSGVQIKIGRTYNEWAAGPSYEWCACKNCHARIGDMDSQFNKDLMASLNSWKSNTNSTQLICPQCHVGADITAWPSKPPFAFGNLTIQFWNWPPFDKSGWKLDISSLIQAATNHRLVYTWGHV